MVWRKYWVDGVAWGEDWNLSPCNKSCNILKSKANLQAKRLPNYQVCLFFRFVLGQTSQTSLSKWKHHKNTRHHKPSKQHWNNTCLAYSWAYVGLNRHKTNSRKRRWNVYPHLLFTEFPRKYQASVATMRSCKIYRILLIGISDKFEIWSANSHDNQQRRRHFNLPYNFRFWNI